MRLKERNDLTELKKVNELNQLSKDENGDLLADSHSILIIWKNYFFLSAI
jgi:hypothetical protein